MQHSYWGVVPAAGRGERFAGAVPKQYVEIAGRRVIEYSLAPLLDDERLEAVVVSLAEGDERWSRTGCAGDPRVTTCVGGATRSQSVLHALEALKGRAKEDDWVLVHDAVRPCLSKRDLSALIETLDEDPVGGLLVASVNDTLKQLCEEDEAAIERTLERGRAVRALTPQMFRLGPLSAAIGTALARGVEVGDEAQAMELAGHAVRVVHGDPANVKLTHAHELSLIEAWLESNGSPFRRSRAGGNPARPTVAEPHLIK